MFYPQGNFYPQTSFAPLSHPFAPLSQPNAMYPNNLNASFGVPQLGPFFPQGVVPQQTPFFTQSQLPFSNWQQPRQPLGINAFNGIANGAAQPSVGPWSQPQASPEQINPTLQQFNPALQQAQYGQQQAQQCGHSLQQLAQYHNLIAQQLAQLAVQTGLVGSGGTYPFAGQFIPNQLSPNFGSGITMH